MRKGFHWAFLFLFLANHGYAYFSCPKNVQGRTLQHKFFTISFRESESIAEWSCHHLKRENLGFQSNRSAPFTADPFLGNHSPRPTDYSRSGYDRGHLVPAEDMSFNDIAAAESFYMSNMTPQIPAFNRGIWLRAEEKMRSIVKNFGEAVIVSGPVLNGAYQKLPGTNIAIPQYFFKIAFFIQNGMTKTISYIIPNRGNNNVGGSSNLIHNSNLDTELKPYLVPVSEVVKLTGVTL